MPLQLGRILGKGDKLLRIVQLTGQRRKPIGVGCGRPIENQTAWG
jgi:hypothetical protein